ncbi:PPE family protein [Mycobacterium haemophilum]|uniref:PPE family domain-containing protein n=1 Tax=Mycobacterium haemophilum TaxID=29311 RepID=A0A0I9UAF1_9MYCO|nr:PPE family protein [Mycobacterium haemophilum]KLO33717.1 hypothetical protein ABH39_00635 [Mycobacterium haemophilum]KLO39244.1 hypothetical protein ABH38_00635 [Mycobacterium haemophilum]KLO45550.1 hypothetical protein ABH37_00635 [Mycobacterium haemophilum]KLO56702.1 hypothetical protein ABH36_00635 [Mycobacterium haemophilum]
MTGPGGGYVWRAFPPEVPSTLLRKGPGVGPLLAAAEARRSLGNQYALAAEELGAVLTGVQSEAWQGPSAERYVDAHLPHQAWLEQTAADFAEAADQHEVAATAYVTALATMPTVGELAANHVAHTALVSTNFFGINTIPIAANEADYERMWDQAATTMQVYQTVTTAALLTVPPITSAPPIVHPGVGAANDIGADGAVVGDVIWELLLGALCLIRDVFRPIVYAIEVFVEEMYEDWGFEVVWFLEGLVGWIGELVQTPGVLLAAVIAGVTAGVGGVAEVAEVAGVAPATAVSSGVSLPLGVEIPGGVSYLSQVEADFVNTTTANDLTTSNNNKASTNFHVPPSHVVSAVAVADQGAEMVGFAGTAPSPTAAGASGLATLDGGFNGSPQVPLLPATWEVGLVGAPS